MPHPPTPASTPPPSERADRYFLAGPVTDPRTALIAAALRAHGACVTEPQEFLRDHTGVGHQICVRAQIDALLDCTALVLAPGWNNDPDAGRAVGLARDLGMPVHTSVDGRLFTPYPRAGHAGPGRQQAG
ncbi:hypothetical protein [Nocardia sp. IFM 10818]